MMYYPEILPFWKIVVDRLAIIHIQYTSGHITRLRLMHQERRLKNKMSVYVSPARGAVERLRSSTIDIVRTN